MSEFTDKYAKAGALWTREKGGYSGVLNADLSKETRLLILENSKRPGKKDPDFVIYVKREEQPTEEPQPQEEGVPF